MKLFEFAFGKRYMQSQNERMNGKQMFCSICLLQFSLGFRLILVKEPLRQLVWVLSVANF